MNTTVMTPVNARGITTGSHILARGGVIAFPTDTVYGLACDLFNPAAVHRVYEVKGRPSRMPLIAMFANSDQWREVADSLPASAVPYLARWWPGPLTIIAPARPDIPDVVLGGGATIGMRIPDHPAALALLRAVERPLATTSANMSGHPAPRTPQEVVAQLNGTIDLVLDAGATPGGVASTVVDCTVTPPRILREGPITAAMLELQ